MLIIFFIVFIKYLVLEGVPGRSRGAGSFALLKYIIVSQKKTFEVFILIILSY